MGMKRSSTQYEKSRRSVRINRIDTNRKKTLASLSSTKYVFWNKKSTHRRVASVTSRERPELHHATNTVRAGFIQRLTP
jgi:hypothetical protein